MAVVIETTLGDITVDLYLDQRPVTCLNFLKLCKMKYYNYNLFHSIRSGFIAQTGDPTGEGSGGQSVFGVLEGPSKRFFSGEKMPKIRHTNAGLLSMVGTGDMMVGSQFFFTLAPDLDSLDGVHCVIGEVTEGHDVLRKLNEVICDDGHRPYQDVRITHTVILEDPFNDPTGFRAPSRSPSPSAERLRGGRIAPDEEIDETQGKSAQEVQEMIEEKEAKARATILEIVGDLPDADIAPPENVLFVCKLNPVTSDEDLEIIFSRFGKIVSCEVIRDKKTGDSLQYAFIEFSNKKSCEDAYFKMDNVLIDDRRIHVDFSQSVSKMRYLGKGRGVKYLDGNDTDYKNYQISKSNSSQNKNKDRDSTRNHDSDKNHTKKRHEFDNKEKKHKSMRDSNNHRNRSRSRSQPRRNRSRDRKYEKDNHLNSQNSSTHPERSERSSNDNHNHKQRENDSKHPDSSQRSSNVNNNNKHYSNAHNSKSQHSTAREKSKSPQRRHRHSSYSHKDKPDSEKQNKKEKQDDSRKESREYEVDRKREDKESKKRTPKRKHDDSDPSRNSKRMKKYDHSEQEKKDTPRTPTPVEKKQSKKQNKVKNKQRKEEKARNKKRRKHSTSSSETDSSDSTSSSDTSSSSEDRRKRRRTMKRHRRHTSSSSSSSDSSDSSSSTSSSSESSSSSSSSDSEPRKRKSSKKVLQKKNLNKKSKKKS